MPATLIREFAARDAGRLAAVLADLRGLPDRLAERRMELFRDVALGRRAAELHAGRDEYRRVYDDYLGVAERYRGLAEAAGDSSATEFGRVADEVRKQRDDLFGRWHTLDDLHRIMTDHLVLPPDRIAAYAAKYPPPPSFWDETIDPFTAE